MATYNDFDLDLQNATTKVPTVTENKTEVKLLTTSAAFTTYTPAILDLMPYC